MDNPFFPLPPPVHLPPSDLGFSELEMERFVNSKVEELRKLIVGDENQSIASEQFTSSPGECLWSPTPSLISSETTIETNQMHLTMEIDTETRILHSVELWFEFRGVAQEGRLGWMMDEAKEGAVVSASDISAAMVAEAHNKVSLGVYIFAHCSPSTAAATDPVSKPLGSSIYLQQ